MMSSMSSESVEMGVETSKENRKQMKSWSGSPRVRELMTREVFALYEDDTIKFLSDLMKWQRIRHVPVVDQNNHLVGLVSHRGLLEALATSLSAGGEGSLDGQISQSREIAIEEIMQRDPLTVGPDTLLAEAAEIMFTRKFGCLPVVEQGNLVGIITEADFVRSFYQWEVYFG